MLTSSIIITIISDPTKRDLNEVNIVNCLNSNKDIIIGNWIQQPTYTSNIYELSLFDDDNFELNVQRIDNSSLKGEWKLIQDNERQFIQLNFKQLNTFWKEVLDYYETSKSEYYLVDYENSTIKVNISLQNANRPKELKCQREYLVINFLNNTLVKSDLIDTSDFNLNFELAIENYKGECRDFLREFKGSSKWGFGNFNLDLINNYRFVLNSISNEYIDPEKLNEMLIEGNWVYEGEEIVLNIENEEGVAPEISETVEVGRKIRLVLQTSNDCTFNDISLVSNNNIIFKPLDSEFTIF